MPSVKPSVQFVLLALAIGVGGVAASSIQGLLGLLPDLASCAIGAAALMLGAHGVRRYLRGLDVIHPYRRAIKICRTLPLEQRCIGAVALLVWFLLFDRFLDGDPAHFRLFSFVAPILIASALFDLKPGLAAMTASALIFDFFIVPPFGSFVVQTINDALQLAGFAGLAFAAALAGRIAFDSLRHDGKSKPDLPRTPSGETDLYRLFNVKTD